MTKIELRKIWADRVAEYKASGQSISTWCAEHRVKPHQMRYWLRKHREPGESEWIPLEPEEKPESSLTVRAGKVSIEVRQGFDPKLLLAVVNALTSC